MESNLQINFGGKTINILYEKYGHGNRNLVFLHGWGQSLNSFYNIKDKFNPDLYTAYFFDLPGFGRSSTTSSVNSVNDYADTLNLILLKLEIEKPVLVGHSFGARIIYSYINQFSNYSNAVIYGTSHDRSHGLKDNIIYHASVVLGKIFPEIVIWGHSNFLHPRTYANPNESLKYSGQLLKVYENAHEDQDTYPANIDLENPLSVKFVFGGNDRIVNRDSYSYFMKKYQSAGSKFLYNKDASHFFHIDKPEEFIRFITGDT